MKKWMAILLLLLQLIRLNAQSNLAAWEAVTSNHGLGNANALALISNGAALTHLRGPEGFMSSNINYGITDLRFTQLGFALPISSFTAGGFIGSLSTNEIMSTQAELAVARNLKKVDLAVSFRYHQLSARMYRPVYGLVPGVSMIVHLTERMNIGMQFFNPSNNKWSTGYKADLILVLYSSSWCYKFSEQLRASIEVSKEFQKSLNYSTTLCYQIDTCISFSVGVVNNVNNVRMGTAWEKKRLRISVVTNYHYLLGFSCALCLLVKLKRLS